MKRALVLASALAAFAAGCSPGDDTPAEVRDPGPGRLLVGAADGSIYTIDPDGSDRSDITVAEAGVVRAQPTWSPDGRRLAYAETDPSASRLVVADATGGGRNATPVPAPLFYLSWNPRGDRILGLGPAAGGGVDATLITLGGESLTAEDLGFGSPYYASWAPDGGSLLVNDGSGRLVRVELDGSVAPLDVLPAAFQAPDWGSSGRRVFARRGETRDAVVVAAGDAAVDVVVYDGVVAFDLAGSRLAYRVIGDDTASSAAMRFPVPALPGALAVLDLDTGDQTVVSRSPTIAFEWSPDGSRLLFLAVEDGLPGWQVWDGESVTAFGSVVPSAVTRRDYLPFFDQYARSQTAWSPRSDAFAFAGTLDDGRTGVWVVPLEGAGPIEIGAGDVVSWSPAG